MLLPELASDIVDAADEVENTALHFCQKTNCASKVNEILLSPKASVDIKNKAGESALMIAVKKHPKAHKRWG